MNCFHPRILARLCGAAIVLLAEVALAAGPATLGAETADFNVTNWTQVVAHHPNGNAIARLFADPNEPLPNGFAATGLTKKDYLALMAGNVDFWKQYLGAEGAIIDPYEGRERQYATPAFALSAAEVMSQLHRNDLLEPAVRSFSFALTALVNRTTADAHADFYIPMLVHAHRILKSRVPGEVAAKWEQQFKKIVPEQVYRDKAGNGNWNLVNVSGEALRRMDRLVAPDQLDAQQHYLDEMLRRQQRHFTTLGMYLDANAPLAYDAFPRLWMEDMIDQHAYAGPELPAIERLLTLGGLSSLMLISPSGEWPSGGRSAQHQWNEAENAVIAEVNANRWKQHGRPDVAASFKRMAHLALESMLRWQRPSGELWIVKNFADPQQRLGFEGYSFHSQYNLLAMAMLGIAFEHADDSIPEGPIPSEWASYVFDARQPFHKVVLAGGGYYALIDTRADPHYDATGLQRVHRKGVALSPLTDSAAAERAYGGPDKHREALSPGIQWKLAPDGPWTALADFHRPEPPPRPHPAASAPPAPAPASEPAPQQIVSDVELSAQAAGDQVTATLRYALEGPGARGISEKYVVSPDGVECTSTLQGDAPAPAAARFVCPVLVNDGARETRISSEPGRFTVQRAGGSMRLSVLSPAEVKLALDGPRLITHNGYVRAAAANLPAGTLQVQWKVQLYPEPLGGK
jgi:hypothetical protein